MIKLRSFDLVVLFVSIFLFIKIHSCLKIGIHDEIICKGKQTSLPCTHQLKENARNSSSCNVEYIAPKDCGIFNIEKVFNPYELPFALNLYQFRKGIIHNLSFNISFPNPIWKTMSFHIKNQRNPNVHVCRKFILENNQEALINESLYWDCLLFNANYIEQNSFYLFFEDDSHFGGSYSFKAPPLKYFNSTTNINDWHVFFYIHYHHFQSTGDLYVTLQPAPFSNVSYSISLIKCSNDDFKCENKFFISNVVLNYTEYRHMYQNSQITTKLKSSDIPGVYAVQVIILSEECGELGCAISLSPTYEIKQTYILQIVLGLLGVFLFIGFAVFLLIRKFHHSFIDFINGKKGHSDCLLLVYHAHTQEYLEFIQYLVFILKEKFTVQPLIVDEHAGSMNPDEWTRMQLTNCSKILFIIPTTLTAESITPIQNQWFCATKYFSGTYFRKAENISKRYATIVLEGSLPLPKGNEIYTLPRFFLPSDLVSLADWLNRSYLLDRIFLWPSILKGIPKDLTSYINYMMYPSKYKRPGCIMSQLYRSDILTIKEENRHDIIMKEENAVSLNGSNNNSDNEDIERVKKEFDPLIPDVRDINNSDDDDDQLDSDEDESSKSTSNSSSSNVLNFID